MIHFWANLKFQILYFKAVSPHNLCEKSDANYYLDLIIFMIFHFEMSTTELQVFRKKESCTY